jgi:hypothetical protein
MENFSQNKNQKVVQNGELFAVFSLTVTAKMTKENI